VKFGDNKSSPIHGRGRLALGVEDTTAAMRLWIRADLVDAKRQLSQVPEASIVSPFLSCGVFNGIQGKDRSRVKTTGKLKDC
jgi:hypothetical protein